MGRLVVIHTKPIPEAKDILFEVVEAKQQEVHFFNPIGKSRDSLTANDLLVARKLVQEEVTTINGTAILTLGEQAFNIVCGKKDIFKNKGDLHLFDDVAVVPTLQQVTGQQIEQWAKHMYKALSISKGRVTGNTKVVVCDTTNKIKKAVSYCKEVGIACFDFETKKIDKDKGTFEEGFYATSLSLSFQAGSAYVIPLEHYQSPYGKKKVRKIMCYLNRHIFTNTSVRKIAHNLNFDAHVLRVYGCSLRGRLDDTMLMSHLYNELTSNKLKDLVDEYFPMFSGYDQDTKKLPWDRIPLPVLAQYNGTDTDVTLRLSTLLESYLLEDKRLYIIYRNLSMSAFKALFSMEVEGMLIDKDYIYDSIHTSEKHIQEWEEKLKKNKQVIRYVHAVNEQMKEKAISELTIKLEKRVAQSRTMMENKYAEWVEKGKGHKEKDSFYTVTNTETKYNKSITDIRTGKIQYYTAVNFGSPKQVADLLFTNSDGFLFSSNTTSTSKEVLESIDDNFPQDILTLRQLRKIQSTYLKGIYTKLDSNDIVHTQFKIHGTASGRLSSASPNLQNLISPYKIENELVKDIAKMVKKSFIVPEGYTMVQVDFSQAELRIIAQFAKEENMLAVYAQGGDIHSSTAASLLNVPIEDFDRKSKQGKLDRYRAKAVNFGLIYAMSAKGFKDYCKKDYKLILTLKEAEDIRNKFFSMYPNLLNYHENRIDKARKYGWVRTLFGRKRRTPNIMDMDDYIAAMDERIAINSPVQGTAGELTILALSLLHYRLPAVVKMVNTIHDSIIFYIPDEILDSVVDVIKGTMENLPIKRYFNSELSLVSMEVDTETSKENWYELN